MTFWINSGLAVLCFVGAFTGGAAQAQSVKLLGDFRDWSAYTTSEGAGKLCFVFSKAQDTRPKPDGYTVSYIYLTHRPGENIRNELNFVAGYTPAADSEGSISVGGNSYALFMEADAAWLDDPSASDDLAGNMRAGSSMRIEATSATGETIVETFSLSGVTAASRAIDRECAR